MNNENKISPKTIIRLLLMFILLGGILFGGAGSLNWLMAWLFTTTFVGYYAVFLIWSRFYDDKGIAAERANSILGEHFNQFG